MEFRKLNERTKWIPFRAISVKILHCVFSERYFNLAQKPLRALDAHECSVRTDFYCEVCVPACPTHRGGKVEWRKVLLNDWRRRRCARNLNWNNQKRSFTVCCHTAAFKCTVRAIIIIIMGKNDKIQVINWNKRRRRWRPTMEQQHRELGRAKEQNDKNKNYTQYKYIIIVVVCSVLDRNALRKAIIIVKAECARLQLEINRKLCVFGAEARNVVVPCWKWAF